MDNDVKFDRRLVDRLIAKGAVTREEYDKHLAEMRDASGNALNLPAEPAAAAPAPAAKPQKKKGKA